MSCRFRFRWLRAIVALTFAILALPALADPQFRTGIGLQSCDKLAKEMNPDQGFNNAANSLVYYWLQGYMSAANIHLLDDNNQFVDLSTLDEKKILPMIFNYCKSNPDKKPANAIDDLIKKSDKISSDERKSGTIDWSE